MAQSAATVTPPNPTPPTNMQFTGTTAPNPPNYTRGTYLNPVSSPPPYYDDGSAAAAVAFAANKAALASGTTAADNNTGSTPGSNAAGAGGTGFNSVAGSYPGTAAGAVPASTTQAHEGAGTEAVATQTYAASVMVPGSAATYYPTGQTPAWAAGDPGGPTRTAGVGPALTPGTMPQPNQTHPSTLSPAANPTVTSFVPATNTVASGAGTMALQVNGTGFTPQTVIWVNGIPQTTVFTSSVRVDCPTCIKRPTAGTYPVIAVNGGVVQSTSVNYQWT